MITARAQRAIPDGLMMFAALKLVAPMLAWYLSLRRSVPVLELPVAEGAETAGAAALCAGEAAAAAEGFVRPRYCGWKGSHPGAWLAGRALH